MIKVYVKKQSNYPIKASEIKKILRKFFQKQGIVSDAQVNVALVGEKKMLDISNKYLKDSKVHNVLSFTADESESLPAGRQGKFLYPPKALIQLGEIVICYPKVVEEAKHEGKRINQKAEELLKHGAQHLMGKHH